MKPPGAGPRAYLLGTVIAVVAVTLSLALNPILEIKLPFVVSYPAILLSAWVGGPISGVVATLLLTAATAYLWLPPTSSFAIADEGDAIALFVCMGVGAAISGLAVAVQRAPTHSTHREADDGRNSPNTADDRLHPVAEAFAPPKYSFMCGSGPRNLNRPPSKEQSAGLPLSTYRHGRLSGSPPVKARRVIRAVNG